MGNQNVQKPLDLATIFKLVKHQVGFSEFFNLMCDKKFAIFVRKLSRQYDRQSGNIEKSEFS